MSISIKKRIYWSFFLLVLLFVGNGIVSIITLNNNRRLSEHVSAVTDPSLQALEDFEDMLVASKMYTTNWVFLRSNQQDKDALKRLHLIEYPMLKAKLNELSAKWDDKSMSDSLTKIYAGFEQLLGVEKKIMSSLQKFEDYDDPVLRLEAETMVEDEILPNTSSLKNTLSGIVAYELNVRSLKNAELEESSMYLRMLITILAITIISIGIFLSIYMSRIIINPINRIRHIVNDLGKGIIKKTNHSINNDEIGEMVRSVNNLAQKLHGSAVFAAEIGNRNFNSYYEPLSAEDTLGKALVTMRDNLKTSDENLNESQHIAKLGSFELDLKTNKLFWSDEMYNIFDIDSSLFNPKYEGYLSFLHPDDKERANNLHIKCLEDHQPFSYECRIVSGKKISKIICAQGRISKNDKGELTKLSGITQDITERKKAQEQLEEVNRELSILFNSIDEIFFSVNMITLKVIQISSTCEKLYGYEQAEFMADYMLWLNIIHPDDKHVIENENELMFSGKQVNNEYRIIRKDKTIRWVENKITPTLDENGKLVRVDGVTRDITERKKAEEHLMQSNYRFELATRATNDAIWDWDLLTNNVYISDAYEKLFGYRVSGNEMHISSWSNRIHPDDVQKTVESIQNEINNSVTGYWEDEYRYIKQNGNIAYVYDRGQIIYDDKKRPVRMVGAMQDISSRKKAETELQNSEERYRQIVETAQEGIWLNDENNETVFVNKKMCEILEYLPEEMIGKKDFNFMHEKSKYLALQTTAKRKQGIKETYELEFTTKSGKHVWTHISANPVFDEQGVYKGSLAMVTDITKRKNDEELLQKSQLNLEKNNLALEQKNKELEQFAYVASHDLQEPLRTITSFVQIFKQQYFEKLDSKSDKYLKYIVQASDRMRVLIKDLLDYSRIGNNKDLEKVDANIILQDVIADIGKAITDSHAKIEAEHLPVISGYSTELKQLFQNLIVNSIKFRKKNIPLQINISAQRKNDFWQFAFTDNGIGIDQQHNERIFIIFQRLHTRSEYQGSGIGLSHCKKIVELHHGKIWVESIPDEGSTFYFTIHSPKQHINEPKIKLHNAN